MLRTLDNTFDEIRRKTAARPARQGTASPIATTLRAIAGAWREGLAACRQYEELRSSGVPHDRAVREALGLEPHPLRGAASSRAVTVLCGPGVAIKSAVPDIWPTRTAQILHTATSMKAATKGEAQRRAPRDFDLRRLSCSASPAASASSH